MTLLAIIICPGRMVAIFKRAKRKGNQISFVLFSGEDRAEIKVEASSFGADGNFGKIRSSETVFRELSRGIKSAIERARTEIKV
jgi:hypothetical protein